MTRRPVVLAFSLIRGLRALLMAAFAMALAHTAGQPVARAAEAALEPLTIVTSSGPHDFKVEIARSMESRAKGLMFRRSMPQDQGMLFDFGFEDEIAMWMKNTYIPLDMIFVSRSGLVTNVTTDTVPHSLAVISSGGPAYAVIELNAGVARKISVAPGDRVRHKIFGN